MAYTTVPDDAAAGLGLLEADQGANVLLLVPGNRAVLNCPPGERRWVHGLAIVQARFRLDLADRFALLGYGPA